VGGQSPHKSRGIPKDDEGTRGMSILRQCRGAYVNNQQYYELEEIGYGIVSC
jgi:hypothetical protein